MYRDRPELNNFKVALKKWRSVCCPCRGYKVYDVNLNFAKLFWKNLKSSIYQPKYHFNLSFILCKLFAISFAGS